MLIFYLMIKVQPSLVRSLMFRLLAARTHAHHNALTCPETYSVHHNALASPETCV
ncbi:Malolactic regulator [Lactobacillus paracasei subsp. paracasei]|nr:Malolactic regulator [Lacticaseibacillus paracasei]MBG1274695.1 Malolactic regulator [Lacticaseibacillus paracasei subsp. paracasei]AYG22126.1 Malolactic regulator [Lacticaseibacillus paracasei]MCT3318011.1 Malolactic regulator [Lacticaseibacillus paracasei]MCT3324727.1 Malolactic regulator [Lacticaseibacillus paracasei]